MTSHPHRPDWIYVLIASAISLGIILAALTAAAAITLITTGRLT